MACPGWHAAPVHTRLVLRPVVRLAASLARSFRTDAAPRDAVSPRSSRPALPARSLLLQAPDRPHHRRDRQAGQPYVAGLDKRPVYGYDTIPLDGFWMANGWRRWPIRRRLRST